MVNLYVDNVTIETMALDNMTGIDTDAMMNKMFDNMHDFTDDYITPATFHFITGLMIVIMMLSIVIQVLFIIKTLSCCGKKKKELPENYNRMRL